MILIENKFCFIHIPKTSGSSFTQIICKKATTNKKTYNSGGGWQGTYHFNKGYCNGQHTIINDLKNDELKLIENIPIITIVRNPYSWLVSLYESFHGGKGKFYDGKLNLTGPSRIYSLAPFVHCTSSRLDIVLILSSIR